MRYLEADIEDHMTLLLSKISQSEAASKFESCGSSEEAEYTACTTKVETEMKDLMEGMGMTVDADSFDVLSDVKKGKSEKASNEYSDCLSQIDVSLRPAQKTEEEEVCFDDAKKKGYDLVSQGEALKKERQDKAATLSTRFLDSMSTSTALSTKDKEKAREAKKQTLIAETPDQFKGTGVNAAVENSITFDKNIEEEATNQVAKMFQPNMDKKKTTSGNGVEAVKTAVPSISDLQIKMEIYTGNKVSPAKVRDTIRKVEAAEGQNILKKKGLTSTEMNEEIKQML